MLDLGCAHGSYAIEFARRGATVVGIEGRGGWVEQANAAKAKYDLANVEFFQDDVRNLSIGKYGEFDVVLCLGLLYHLGAKDALDLLGSIHGMCRDFVLLDTHVAPRVQNVYQSGDGATYSGWLYREHYPDATREAKVAALGASLDDEFSFWFSKPSLLNGLQRVGFSSVVECQNPVGNVYVDGQLKLNRDRVCLVAFKGAPVGQILDDPLCAEQPFWPERPEKFLLEPPWTSPFVPSWVRGLAKRTRDLWPRRTSR